MTEPKVIPSDFTEAEHAAVDAMAAPVIEEVQRAAKFNKRFLSRNRDATKRMNRPSKAERMSTGADIHLRLIDKGLALHPIRTTETQGI